MEEVSGDSYRLRLDTDSMVNFVCSVVRTRATQYTNLKQSFFKEQSAASGGV